MAKILAPFSLRKCHDARLAPNMKAKLVPLHNSLFLLTFDRPEDQL
jgi:hypothetical protein